MHISGISDATYVVTGSVTAHDLRALLKHFAPRGIDVSRAQLDAAAREQLRELMSLAIEVRGVIDACGAGPSHISASPAQP